MVSKNANCRVYNMINERISFIGHENNVHCLAIAVNAIAGAVFAFYSGQDQKDKMKEFIIVNQFQV